MAEPPAMAEISELLDQLSPEELSSILQTIENDGLMASSTGPPAEATSNGPPKDGGTGKAQESAPEAIPRAVPLPPTAPPSGGPRRPARGQKPTAPAKEDADGDDGGATVTMAELKRLLQEHSAGVVSEVKKLIPANPGPPAPPPAEAIDMGTLTRVLAERDQEEKALEARLADLQAELLAKEKCVQELSGELDSTVREVRHRQLDLEFQQLKLEERVRSNTELEQAQQSLSARVAEASLASRHATIDADMCRFTPRAIRAQGSLPWTLRKNKLPGL